MKTVHLNLPLKAEPVLVTFQDNILFAIFAKSKENLTNT